MPNGTVTVTLQPMAVAFANRLTRAEQELERCQWPLERAAWLPEIRSLAAPIYARGRIQVTEVHSVPSAPGRVTV